MTTNDEIIPLVKDDDGETVLYKYKDKKYCLDERALAQLLKDGLLTVDSFHYTCQWKEGDSLQEPDGITLSVDMNCNDLFAYASADSEDITIEELPELFEMHMADKRWGAIKWCCKKRKALPIKPHVKAMKKDGAWEKWMGKL